MRWARRRPLTLAGEAVAEVWSRCAPGRLPHQGSVLPMTPSQEAHVTASHSQHFPWAAGPALPAAHHGGRCRQPPLPRTCVHDNHQARHCVMWISGCSVVVCGTPHDLPHPPTPQVTRRANLQSIACSLHGVSVSGRVPACQHIHMLLVRQTRWHQTAWGQRPRGRSHHHRQVVKGSRPPHQGGAGHLGPGCVWVCVFLSFQVCGE